MLRFDAAIARLAMTQVRSGKLEDFMPWPKHEEPEATLQGIAALLTPAKKRKP